MPFCRKCGNPTVESDQFCAKCGAAITTPAAVAGERQASDAPPTRRRHRATLIVIAVVVLAIIACALVFDMERRDRGNLSVATLPVHVLPTEEGSQGAQPPSYPATVEAKVPREWLHQIEAYGVAGVVLLAPERPRVQWRLGCLSPSSSTVAAA
jgi:predicted nucleic acid-binding Zn ribbon protein